jgi:glyoxylase-like metal-dependent hydrolase (beta-lactamase superfamily II)
MATSILGFTAGPLDTNSFLATDEETGLALIVDAPWHVAPPLAEEVQKRHLRVRFLVITHAHWDHFADADALRAAVGASIVTHHMEASRLEAPAETLYQVPFEIPSVHPDALLEEGDLLEIGGFHFHVMHTPGHSPGSICLYEPDRKLLFSGDTLFHNGYGRTDLPGANEEELWKSLARLAELPEETRVLPGHGPETTLGQELWLKRIPADL